MVLYLHKFENFCLVTEKLRKENQVYNINGKKEEERNEIEEKDPTLLSLTKSIILGSV